MYLFHNKGIYNCNGKYFFNKIEAILEANVSGQHIGWDYHDQVFNKYRWDIEPPVSIEQLYKERALQLRDVYDHLALFFSAGADSWYILKTFIDNNIKLDEIYIYGAWKAEEKEYNSLGYDRSPGYYTREINQAIPLIKKLIENKGIKLNLFDWTEPMIKAADNRDWFITAGTRHDPTCMVRPQFHKIFREHSELTHKGKNVGFIYGIDKPRLIRDDHNVYFAFLDVIMTTGTVPSSDILGETWENDEYFYWTPNMPEIAIKQSHLALQWFKKNNLIHKIKHVNNIAAFHDEDYYKCVNNAIYPQWDPKTWQIKKPSGAVYNEISNWFYKEHPEAVKKWESSLWEMERLCGKKWFNGDSVRGGIRGHLSPKYLIGSY